MCCLRQFDQYIIAVVVVVVVVVAAVAVFYSVDKLFLEEKTSFQEVDS